MFIIYSFMRLSCLSNLPESRHVFPHTASTQPEAFRVVRGAGGTGERTVSFSEVRWNLSRKAGKSGGESWPQSQLSSAHGGEVLQEFSVICVIHHFFPSFCFSSSHRGNKKPFVLPSLLLPGPPGRPRASPPAYSIT